MLTTMEVDVTGGLEPLRRPAYRYGLLRRLRLRAEGLGVRVYAFGFGHRHLRLLLSGGGLAQAELSKGLKVTASNTARHQGERWRGESTWCRAWRGTVLEGATWVQRDVLDLHRRDALASPWTSHRDAVSVRCAPFFDPVPLRRAVDVVRLHRACSQGPLPRTPKRIPSALRFDLNGLFRVAAAVHGVMPADRACFATFVQLSSRCGASRSEVAAALAVGERRVRHYLQVPTPGVEPALKCLTDVRLLHVP